MRVYIKYFLPTQSLDNVSSIIQTLAMRTKPYENIRITKEISRNVHKKPYGHGVIFQLYILGRLNFR